MSLQVWLPLTKDLRNQGLSNIEVINNGATFNSAGKLGGCYSFDGADDYINLGTSLNNIIKGSSNPFSICFWVKSQENSTRGVIFSSYGLPNTSNFFSIEVNSGSVTNNSLRFDWKGTDVKYFTGAVTYNQWVHLTITYDGSIIKCYQNGILFDSITYTLATLTSENSYYIGRDSRTGTTALSGYINDFRIYDHCLSPQEVKRISQGLVLHYTLSDDSLESTINLAKNSITITSSTWGGHTRIVSKYDASNDPVPFDEGYKVDVTYDSSVGGGGVSIPISGAISNIKGSTEYTFSLYIKASDNFTYVHPNFLYTYGDGAGKGRWVTVGGQYPKQNIGNGWYRIWGTFTTESSTTSLSSLYFYTYPAKNMTYWIGGWQLEEKNHITPYVTYETARVSSTVYDSSGFCNNGIKTGDIIVSNDTPKYIASTILPNTTTTTSFDDKCWITAPLILNGASSFTVAFWFKKEAITRGGLFTTGTHTTTVTTLAVNDYDNSVRIVSNDGVSLVVGGYGHLTTDWCHWVMTFDGINAKIYINGILDSSAAYDTTKVLKDISQITIGANAAGGVYRTAKGNYSDLRIYATALSAEEVLSLYQNSATIDSNGVIHGQIR